MVFLFCFFLSEAGLRLAHVSYPSLYGADEDVGLWGRPFAQGYWRSEGFSRNRFNSGGLRDVEHSLQKPEGVFRIAVLGDSFTEALQVQMEESFPKVLETMLNKERGELFRGRSVEVLNFGISGAGTLKEKLILEKKAMPYTPDMVILAFFAGNDVRNNSCELERDPFRICSRMIKGTIVPDTSLWQSDAYISQRSWQRRMVQSLSDYSVTIQALNLLRVRFSRGQKKEAASFRSGREWSGVEKGVSPEVFIPPETKVWQDAWHITEDAVTQIAGFLKERNIPLILLGVSSGVQVVPDAAVRKRFLKKFPGADFSYPDRRMEKLCAKLNIPYIPTVPPFLQEARQKGTFFHGFTNTQKGQGHWNRNGHRRAAELLYHYFKEHPFPKAEI